ncbi:MAG: rRNA maturation RNase YbeY [Planctomycetaceae bacterium]|nr:rRNA maturation RNase YbeY [Planctomycetaceae bacterium]
MLQRAVRIVLEGESVTEAEVSIAIVDDTAIHLLNRKYLDHDYATDVLSFLLSDRDDPLEGEIIVSADTAKREASRYAWDITDELLLYIIHGALHLVSYDDVSECDREQMRAKEREYLEKLGRTHPNVRREDMPQGQSATEPPLDNEGKP